MEFHVALRGGQPDLGAFEDVLLQADPGAVYALNEGGDTLSVSAFIEADELAWLLLECGCPATTAQIEQVPSLCCGGCT